MPFAWQQLEFECEVPCPRAYHSASLCEYGIAKGMIVIFGGRSTQQTPLNDTWGLRRHKSGVWDWIKPPSKPNQSQPLARYQHSSIFVGSLMFVLGGKTN